MYGGDNPERQARPSDAPRPTRRSFLAAGGTVALAGLAGCTALEELVGQATDRAVGTTAASPAGVYTVPASAVPDGREGAYASGPVEVRFLPATVRTDAGEFELEGWSTSTATRAQDYNSSRSNKPRTVWWESDDDDSDGDGVGTLVAALDTERALVVYLDDAIEAVDRRSGEDAKRALNGFLTATTGALRDEGKLANCPTDSCGTVRQTLERCRALVEPASGAVDSGEWDRASTALGEARRLLAGDTERLLGDLDSDGDGLADGTEELYAYLDGDPVIGERFAVALPDARLEGGPSVAAELTPRRVMEYFVGERDADGCLETGDLVVHRDLACRSLLTAALDEETDKGRAVRAVSTGDGVVITCTVPQLEEVAPMVFVSGNDVTVPESLASWGPEREVGSARVTPTLVCPATAQPPDCPAALPALFYLRRVRHDDQCVYTGGWLLDDGALYADSASLLVGEDAGVVAGVTTGDIEGDGSITIEGLGGRRKRPGRARYGDITLKKGYARDAEYLPVGAAPVCPAAGAGYWAVQSQEAYARGGDCDDGDPDVRPTALVTALDAPLLHLVEAAEASNEVKFKAGAELSKAVN